MLLGAFTSESKRLLHHYEIKLLRGTFAVCLSSLLMTPGVAVPPEPLKLRHHPWLVADKDWVLYVFSHIVW